MDAWLGGANDAALQAFISRLPPRLQHIILSNHTPYTPRLDSMTLKAKRALNSRVVKSIKNSKASSSIRSFSSSIPMGISGVAALLSELPELTSLSAVVEVPISWCLIVPSQVTSLSLECCHVGTYSGNSARINISSIATAPQLRHLRLAGTQCYTMGAAEGRLGAPLLQPDDWWQLLSGLPRLQHADLTGAHIAVGCQPAQHLSHLQARSLSPAQGRPSAAARLAACLPSLQVLVLSEYAALSVHELRELAALLPDLPSLDIINTHRGYSG